MDRVSLNGLESRDGENELRMSRVARVTGRAQAVVLGMMGSHGVEVQFLRELDAPEG